MGSGKKSLVWARVACVVITALALFLLFRRIDSKVLLQTFQMMRHGWYLGAFALYGLLFAPAAWRWHLALRLNDTVVRFAATARLSLIGHFFYTILFGAVGGDTAKCALYARWYQLPLPDVLVAASLDRLMGSGGLILFAGLAFGVAAFHSGFTGFRSMSVHLSGPWMLLALVLAVIVLLLLRRTRRESIWVRFANGFLASGRKLLSSPGTIIPGALCGLLVQMALSGVLAMNLQAVSHSPVPWLQLAWTFPAISVVSALPISIAGLGVRDSAAFLLLGLFGISGADAVAAALLTASIGIAWAVIDGLLLWHESNRQHEWRLPKTISAILPAGEDEDRLVAAIQGARAVPEITEIVVTGAEADNQMRELAVAAGCRVLAGPSSRGGQPQCAAAQATGDVFLFLDTNARLPGSSGRAILRVLRDSSVAGGSIRDNGRTCGLCVLTSWLACAWRVCFRRVSTNKTIFLRREVFEWVNRGPDARPIESLDPSGVSGRVGRWTVVDAETDSTVNSSELQELQPACACGNKGR